MGIVKNYGIYGQKSVIFLFFRLSPIWKEVKCGQVIEGVRQSTRVRPLPEVRNVRIEKAKVGVLVIVSVSC